VPTVSEKVLNYFFFGDEFMSNIIDQHTYRTDSFLEKNQLENKDEIINNLKNLLKSEFKYKNEKKYQVINEEDQENNQEIIYKQGVLKKYIESDLYLKSDQKRDGFFVEQIYYSIAAGVSMIFATAIAFSFQQKFGNFTMPLFAALVVSYMQR
jgi:lipopolysaccharide export LptBFGC system permease protein LptF